MRPSSDRDGYSVRYCRPAPGDPPVLVASAEKAKRILQWAPKYGELADIIATAWRWHSRQQKQVVAP